MLMIRKMCFNMDDLCKHKSLTCSNVRTKSEMNKEKDTRRESSVTMNTDVGVRIHYEGKAAATRS